MSEETEEAVTRIGEAMLEGWKSSPGFDPEEAKILILISLEHGGGIASFGYGGEANNNEVIADVLFTLRRLLQSQGQDFLLVPPPQFGSQN